MGGEVSGAANPYLIALRQSSPSLGQNSIGGAFSALGPYLDHSVPLWQSRLSVSAIIPPNLLRRFHEISLELS